MTEQERPSAPDRTLLAIGLGILGLVVVATVLVLALGSQEPTQFAEDTPEGAVQRYLAAFDDGDYEAAHAYFSTDVREQMDAEEFERAIRDYGFYPADTSRRVLFDESEIDGSEATVRLVVEEFYGSGPFGGGDTFRSERDVHLVNEDGSWRIDEALVGLEPAPFPIDEPFGG